MREVEEQVLAAMQRLLGKEHPWHVDVMVHDGANSGNTDFRNALTATTKTDFGVATRVDRKLFGDWLDTTDMTGKNSGKNDLLDVGGGLDFSQADNVSAVRWTADAQYLAAHCWTIFGARCNGRTWRTK